MSKISLDTIVNHYRREESGKATGRHLEFEIRTHNVDAPNFASIYQSLLSEKSKNPQLVLGQPILSQTISALMPMRTRPAGVSVSRAPGAPQMSSLREIQYENGKKVGEKYSHKEPLMLPWHSPRGSGLAYSVSLAAEIPDERGVAADESAIIRIKARVGFPLEIPSSEDDKVMLAWRIDMTIVREFSGTEAESIKSVIKQMFGTTPPMTTGTLLRSLGIITAEGEIVPSVAAVYRFEVEVEFIAAQRLRDLLRAADVTAAADFVLSLASPERVRDAALQAAVFRAAKYISRGTPGELRSFEHERGLRQLLPQARSLTRAEYREKYPPRGYFLTDKADGRRALGFACDGRGMIAASELYEFKALESATGFSSNQDTILDGELVMDKEGQLTFYAFDVIVVNGADMTSKGFEVRVLRIAEGVAALVAAGVPARAKDYAHIVSAAPADIERAVRTIHEAKRPYEVDGLIFVEPEQNYSKTLTYKWKSVEHNTIDFLARRPPAGVLGRGPFVDKPGHKLYYLFVGVAPQMYSALGMQRCPGYAELFGTGSSGYFPIQFAPSDVPLAYLYDHPDLDAQGTPSPDVEGQIIEMRCSGHGKCYSEESPARINWELVRVREDRRRDLMQGIAYFGNDFRIAELTWLNYIDVFPIEQLWNGTGSDYFQKPRAGIYRAQTAVMNFAKTRLIETLAGASWVVDVGTGRGGDLGRYFNAGVGHLIAIDNDRAALAELVRRRFDHAKRNPTPIGSHSRPSQQSGRGTTLYILAADANDPAAALRGRLSGLNLPDEGADALVCNLAVHYFMRSTESMKNFAAFAKATVRPGGNLVLTVLVGELVHKAFQESGIEVEGSWDRNEVPLYHESKHDSKDSRLDEQLALRKYSMRRYYTSKSLEAAGQRISVLLPFSDGQYYDEYLVNVAALSKVLAARGFGAPMQTSVANSVDEFAAQNRPLAAELTVADRDWLGLYATLVYRREK